MPEGVLQDARADSVGLGPFLPAKLDAQQRRAVRIHGNAGLYRPAEALGRSRGRQRAFRHIGQHEFLRRVGGGRRLRIGGIEHRHIDRIHHRLRGNGGSGNGVDIRTQRQLAGFAQELLIERGFLGLFAVSGGLRKLIVADDDFGDDVVFVQLDFHIHRPRKAVYAGRIASLADFAAGSGAGNFKACKAADFLHGRVHGAQHGVGRNRRRGNGVDIVFPVAQRQRRGFAHELAGKRLFLGLGAQAGRFGKAGAADLNARQHAFRIRAHDDFHRAAVALHGHLRDVADGGPVRGAAFIAVVRAAVLRQRELLEGLRLGHQAAPRLFGSAGGLLGDHVFGDLVGRAQARRCENRNDAQHDPCRKLCLHPLFLPNRIFFHDTG